MRVGEADGNRGDLDGGVVGGQILALQVIQDALHLVKDGDQVFAIHECHVVRVEEPEAPQELVRFFQFMLEERQDLQERGREVHGAVFHRDGMHARLDDECWDLSCDRPQFFYAGIDLNDYEGDDLEGPLEQYHDMEEMRDFGIEGIRLNFDEQVNYMLVRCDVMDNGMTTPFRAIDPTSIIKKIARETNHAEIEQSKRRKVD